jgi:CBS domain-containing protein/SAM-dependent methyltransferase
MKISEIMQAIISSTTEDASLKEAGKDIFSLGISAIPVVKGHKLVGIVTRRDILSRIYPSITELTEDYIHLRDFDQMEKRLKDVLDAPVSEIMKRDVTAVTPDTPIMNAQSFMLTNDFSHLPVVDKNNNLLGIVSQGDIFRRLIKDEVPRMEKEKYADFVKAYFDSMVDWEQREKHEIAAITTLFDKEKVKTVLEVGVWTGQFTIELARLGRYKILGLDHSPVMIDFCNQKRNKLSKEIKNKLKFLLTDYRDFSTVNHKFDAALCVGNGLAFVPAAPSEVLPKLAKTLKKGSVIVLQVLNFDRILRNKGKLLSFKDKDKNKIQDNLYMEFFERKNNTTLMYNLALFNKNWGNWSFRGMTSVEINYINENILKIALEKAGFKDISFYGGEGKYKGDNYRFDLNKKFNKDEDEWIIVVARRK